MNPDLTIVDAMMDEQLFRPFLAGPGNSISTWLNWMAALRTLYSLPIPQSRRELVAQCTGRNASSMPVEGFTTALFLCGRRSGKSRMAAVIAAYEALFAGHEQRLAPGEVGVVGILAPSKAQSALCFKYLRAIFDSGLLRNQVVAETATGFDLLNGISIRILANDPRTVRGFSLVAAIVDEVAAMGSEDESKLSDVELINALTPALSMTNGKLICISTPHAKRGYCWTQFERYHGNVTGSTLVWNAPSRTMNPTLPQSVVDKALAEDLQSAKREYLAEFTDSVSNYVSRDVLDQLVVKGRQELMPDRQLRYQAFCDLASGNGKDSSALCIAHRDNTNDGRIIIDLLREYKPPNSPRSCCCLMAAELKLFGLGSVTGDRAYGQFSAEAFKDFGIKYITGEVPKNSLYLSLLPALCSGQISLLDNPTLINQLASLERRCEPGSRDVVDHPRNQRDDLANVVAGVVSIAASRTSTRIGALRRRVTSEPFNLLGRSHIYE